MTHAGHRAYKKVDQRSPCDPFFPKVNVITLEQFQNDLQSQK